MGQYLWERSSSLDTPRRQPNRRPVKYLPRVGTSEVQRLARDTGIRPDGIFGYFRSVSDFDRVHTFVQRHFGILVEEHGDWAHADHAAVSRSPVRNGTRERTYRLVGHPSPVVRDRVELCDGATYRHAHVEALSRAREMATLCSEDNIIHGDISSNKSQ